MTRTILTSVFALSLLIPAHGAHASASPDWVTVPNTDGNSCIDRSSIKRQGTIVFYRDKTCGDFGGFAPMSSDNKVDCSQNMGGNIQVYRKSVTFGVEKETNAAWEAEQNDPKTLGGIVPAYVCSLGR
jgi:hypothetical protein